MEEVVAEAGVVEVAVDVAEAVVEEVAASQLPTLLLLDAAVGKRQCLQQTDIAFENSWVD